MKYMLNSNYAGTLPENEPVEYESLVDLAQGLNDEIAAHLDKYNENENPECFLWQNPTDYANVDLETMRMYGAITLAACVDHSNINDQTLVWFMYVE